MPNWGQSDETHESEGSGCCPQEWEDLRDTVDVSWQK